MATASGYTVRGSLWTDPPRPRAQAAGRGRGSVGSYRRALALAPLRRWVG